MIKAGSIIGIIAGLLGVLAGFVTLFFGGLTTAFSMSGADTVVGLGWGGIVFSMLVVIYGAIASSKPKAGATGLILSSIGGIILGGTLVAILLVLSLVAGGMVALAKSKDVLEAQHRWQGVAIASIFPVVFAAVIGGNLFGGESAANSSIASAPVGQLLIIGQTARSNQFEVTVLDVSFAEQVGDGLAMIQAEPGNVFAVIKVKVRCIDDESRFYSEGNLYSRFNGKDLKYDHSEVVIGLDSPMGMINPMTEKSGFVVYKIPAETPIDSLTWQPSHEFSEQRFSLNAPAGVETASPSQAQSSNTSTTENGSSSFVGPNSSELELVADDNGVVFRLNAQSKVDESGMVNSGSAEGLLHPENGSAVWKDDEFDCTLGFAISDSTVTVQQQGGCGFGMNVSAEGTYIRK